MHKQTGAILLVAGTCIGSGMIALPMVLAKIGIIPTLFLMLIVWFFMYYTSLINLELNLQTNQGMALGSLGRHYSGKGAEWIGNLCLKLLSFSLIAVYIYGGSSILKQLILSKFGIEYPFESIAACYAVCVMMILLFPVRMIDYFNRLLFIGLISVVSILITGLTMTINWNHLPLFSAQAGDPTAWMALIPVVFTSFGFQVIFHTLTNYCHGKALPLKRAFFWGSLIPAIVYILWTCCTLSIISQDNPQFYLQMAAGKAEVGELIQELSGIAKWEAVEQLVWWISLLAIATSVIGVGVGLFDSISGMLAKGVPNTQARSLIASVTTVFPAYLAVIFVPNAFISVLGFAGMILAVIAILLPVYLFRNINLQKLHYSELKWKVLIFLSVIVGVIVIICELFNIVYA